MTVAKRKKRLSLVQAKVNVDELQEIHTKAFVYCDGNVGAYIRKACLEFRPVTKKEVKDK
jgi:hypothetical protein